MAVLSHRLWGGVGVLRAAKNIGVAVGVALRGGPADAAKNIGVAGMLYLARLLRRLCAFGRTRLAAPFRVSRGPVLG